MSLTKIIIRTPNYRFIILAISIILLMFLSNRILYVRKISPIIINVLVFLGLVIYLLKYKRRILYLNRFCFIGCLLIVFIYLYDQFWVGTPTPLHIFYAIIKILCACVIITMPPVDQKRLLRCFETAIQFIVGIALVGWFLFLSGFSLPYYIDLSDPFYTHTVFYFFNLNGPPEQLMPRFAGPFLEPGHVGTMCVFLLYINGFDLKKIGNIILLLGVLFSLSLAAYGLLVGASVLTLYSKDKWIWIYVIIGFFITCGVVAISYNGGDNPINQAIMMRLEMDDSGEIAGANRTSGNFDKAYERYLKSDDMLLGIGNKAFGEKEDGSDNLTIGTATFKRFFFLRGIVGSGLMLIFLFYYWYKYRNKNSSGFLVVYIVANCIRDYPTMEMWMFLYLMAIPYLGEKHESKYIFEDFVELVYLRK